MLAHECFTNFAIAPLLDVNFSEVIKKRAWQIGSMILSKVTENEIVGYIELIHTREWWGHGKDHCFGSHGN